MLIAESLFAELTSSSKLIDAQCEHALKTKKRSQKLTKLKQL